jgi:hypothetical protein
VTIQLLEIGCSLEHLTLTTSVYMLTVNVIDLDRCFLAVSLRATDADSRMATEKAADATERGYASALGYLVWWQAARFDE